MKLAWTLFGLLLALCAVVTYILLLPEPPGAAGVEHPVFETMQRGGDGPARHAPVLGAAWILGLLEIAFFVGLLALGARRHRQVGAMPTAIFVGLGLFAAAFTAMVMAYGRFAGASSPELVMSFPRPTAWMLYALWPVPIYFLVLYVVQFHRWVLPREELETFHRIVARRRERGE